MGALSFFAWIGYIMNNLFLTYLLGKLYLLREARGVGCFSSAWNPMAVILIPLVCFSVILFRLLCLLCYWQYCLLSWLFLSFSSSSQDRLFWSKIQIHKRFKRTLFIRTKTHSANIRGNPISQATKQHLTVKGEKWCKAKSLTCFGLSFIIFLCLEELNTGQESNIAQSKTNKWFSFSPHFFIVFLPFNCCLKDKSKVRGDFWHDFR